MLLAFFIPAWLLVSCSHQPPKSIDNSCELFAEKRAWYRATRDSAQHWGVSIGTQLAFVHQESRFDSDAKTPRRKLLWIIPWTRPSSAYGYAQAVDDTWQWYRRETGNRSADRDDFADAVDFIGWYTATSRRMLGIAKNDVYRQYLAFHEGQGGFQNKSYLGKPWLMRVAREVAQRAKRYDRQLAACEKRLQRSLFWWPF